MKKDIQKDLRDIILNWPAPAQSAFHGVRRIISNTQGSDPDLTVIETLKWGQPAWLPDRPRVGSTLRVNWAPARSDHLSLYVHCQTTLAETMRTLYPNSFEYEGNRAMHMLLAHPLPAQALAHCAVLTLTYHRKTA